MVHRPRVQSDDRLVVDLEVSSLDHAAERLGVAEGPLQGLGEGDLRIGQAAVLQTSLNGETHGAQHAQAVRALGNGGGETLGGQFGALRSSGLDHFRRQVAFVGFRPQQSETLLGDLGGGGAVNGGRLKRGLDPALNPVRQRLRQLFQAVNVQEAERQIARIVDDAGRRIWRAPAGAGRRRGSKRVALGRRRRSEGSAGARCGRPPCCSSASGGHDRPDEAVRSGVCRSTGRRRPVPQRGPRPGRSRRALGRRFPPGRRRTQRQVPKGAW